MHQPVELEKHFCKLWELSHELLQIAQEGSTAIEFFSTCTASLLTATQCSRLELRLCHDDVWIRWEGWRAHSSLEHRLETFPVNCFVNGQAVPAADDGGAFERLCATVAAGETTVMTPCSTAGGRVAPPAVADASDALCPPPQGAADLTCLDAQAAQPVAMIPFDVDPGNKGLLILRHLSPRQVIPAAEHLEGMARILGAAIAFRRARSELRERVKELTCLYGIARITESADISDNAIFGQIAELLPPAMQFPELVAVRVCVEAEGILVGSVAGCPHVLSQTIRTNGERDGVLEIGYTESLAETTGPPFLEEERSLVEAVARELAHLIRRRSVELERQRLQEQIRHADRLATIGQLAAGVAHELNEPLANILGFGQLVLKEAEVSEQARKDVEKIVNASLYAREVIRKLMLFARQMPPRNLRLELNALVEDSLTFFEARCQRAGITLRRELQQGLPELASDPAQIRQVLVNLVVNAIQALPDGGVITIATRDCQSSVELEVADTGCGMAPDVQERIFLPFFTTKDVGEGTGLGLAVVHGIVTAHGGRIRVDSFVGKGTRFVVSLPVDGSERGDQEESQ